MDKVFPDDIWVEIIEMVHDTAALGRYDSFANFLCFFSTQLCDMFKREPKVP
jgi:hypothetical protein